MPTPTVFAIGLESHVRPVARERAHGGFELPVTIVPGVGAHRTADGLRHRSSFPVRTVAGVDC